MTSALESDGRFEVAKYPKLAGYRCHGCEELFILTEIVEVFYDRIGHRCYIIHYKCWDALAELLERRE